jgi:bacteriocin-like protein
MRRGGRVRTGGRVSLLQGNCAPVYCPTQVTTMNKKISKKSKAKPIVAKQLNTKELKRITGGMNMTGHRQSTNIEDRR